MRHLKVSDDLVDILVKNTNAGFMMGGIKPEPVGISQMSPTAHDISVVIGMVGKRNGTVTLNISNRAACMVAKEFVGSEFEEANAEVFDAVGEVTNIIGGRLKADLDESYAISHISCPSVIVGGDYRVHHFQGFEIISVDFLLPTVPTIVFRDKVISVTLSMSKN